MEDKVNSPEHYTKDPSGVECIQITRHRNFNIGNAIKYLWRAGFKSEPTISLQDKTIEDLNKAVWYIVDEIHRLGGECTVATQSSSDKQLRIDNECVIQFAMNYNKELNGRHVTILGLSNNSNDVKDTIKRNLDYIINDLINTNKL